MSETDKLDNSSALRMTSESALAWLADHDGTVDFTRSDYQVRIKVSAGADTEESE